MKHLKKVVILLTALLPFCSAKTQAEEGSSQRGVSFIDSVQITFPQSKWNLDPDMGDNARSLDRISRRLTDVFNDSVFRMRHVTVYGGASPEGSVEFNKFLSEQRANTLFGWFDKFNRFSTLDKTFTFFGRDWEGVLNLAQNDDELPYRDETLDLLRSIVDEKKVSGGKEPAKSLERVKKLRGGVPYRYLYRNIFPKVRASKVVIEYDRVPAPNVERRPTATVVKRDTVLKERVVMVRDTVYIDTCKKGTRALPRK